jgi:hypothetical protein
MPVLTIEPEKIYELVDQLDSNNKLEIFRRLKPQILSKRWLALFARIDKRKAIFPITEEEINNEIECAREEIASHRG